MARALRRCAPLALSACGFAIATTCVPVRAEEPPHSAALDEAIIKSAARHGVPESLVRRVVMRESKYNPHARNHSFWGLMQISYPTARSMGFHGSPAELLNPVVNLRYAVPYLANAFVIAGRRQDAAIRLYAHGYYEAAKHRGLLSALRTADSSPLSGVPDEPDIVAASPPPPPPQEDGGIFGALFGPQQMQRDPQTEQVAYAPPPASADAPPTATPPTDGKSGDEIAMTADRHGALRPPKSWQHDGGTTVIARGEQGIEQVAAYSQAADASEAHGRSRHRTHKSTLFASLDAPPAGAQAYAAVAGGGDPRLMQTESQAAIAQATSGQAANGQALADPQQGAAAPPAAPAPQPQVAADDAPAKTGRRRHVARRGRHHGEDSPATVASSPSPNPQQAAALPQGAPTQAADAGAMQAQQPEPGEAMQPAPADASGQSAEAATPQAQPQQQATADDPAEATPSRKHKHRSRHARARKTTDVAAQSPADGQPRPAESQPK